MYFNTYYGKNLVVEECTIKQVAIDRSVAYLRDNYELDGLQYIEVVAMGEDETGNPVELYRETIDIEIEYEKSDRDEHFRQGDYV